MANLDDKYGRQMKKGVLDMLVLKLLENGNCYGYQLINELKERSKGTFLLKDGTLYPILYRLEGEGLVESKWSEAQGKQVPRKYYAITESGKTVLSDIENTWQQIVEGINHIMKD